MSEIKCEDCTHSHYELEARRETEEGIVVYFDVLKCGIGYKIQAGGKPDPHGNGEYFEPK